MTSSARGLSSQVPSHRMPDPDSSPSFIAGGSWSSLRPTEETVERFVQSSRRFSSFATLYTGEIPEDPKWRDVIASLQFPKTVKYPTIDASPMSCLADPEINALIAKYPRPPLPPALPTCPPPSLPIRYPTLDNTPTPFSEADAEVSALIAKYNPATCPTLPPLSTLDINLLAARLKASQLEGVAK